MKAFNYFCGLITVVCVLGSFSCASEKETTNINPTKAYVERLIKEIYGKELVQMHSDQTPAMKQLIDIGVPALKYGVLELLLNEDSHTRLLAEIVLADITKFKMGSSKQGYWQDSKQEEKWKTLWRMNGSYDWRDTYRLRQASYKKWKKWVAGLPECQEAFRVIHYAEVEVMLRSERKEQEMPTIVERL